MTPTEETRKPYPRGTYSKVARRLSVTPQHVRLVALGTVKSARVMRELAREQRKAADRAECVDLERRGLTAM